MKQLGNLAIVCARRKDVTLRIEQGRVMVLLDGPYAPTAFSADWDDDEKMCIRDRPDANRDGAAHPRHLLQRSRRAWHRERADPFAVPRERRGSLRAA